MCRPLLLLPLVALGLAGCARQASGLPPGVEIEDLPESEAWDVSFRTSADGARQMEVHAPYLARYVRDSAYVYLGPAPSGGAGTPVTVRRFDAGGAEQGTVRAPEVWLYESEGRVVAQGGARATVPEGEGASVQAQQLTLAGGRVEAQGEARAEVQGTGGASVQAARLALEGGRIDASGGVRASVQSGGGAQIQAPRLVVQPGGSFVASGGATVQIQGRANATVRARTIRGAGGRYTAEGGVRVETVDGKTLTAGRVIWDEAAGRFSAPGAFAFDGATARVRGVGLSATADLSRYSMRQVTGEIEVSE